MKWIVLFFVLFIGFLVYSCDKQSNFDSVCKQSGGIPLQPEGGRVCLKKESVYDI
jgi:hypothetical protein